MGHLDRVVHMLGPSDRVLHARHAVYHHLSEHFCTGVRNLSSVRNIFASDLKFEKSIFQKKLDIEVLDQSEKKKIEVPNPKKIV